MDKTINFEKIRETKGTYVYKEIVPEGEKAVVVTLYVRKEALGEEKPEKLVVNIKGE